jgi:hypothetical protein
LSAKTFHIAETTAGNSATRHHITVPAVAPAKDINSGIDGTTRKAAKKNSCYGAMKY